MIEKKIFDYMAEAMDVPVGMEVPADHGDTYIVIQKTGSAKENLIISSSIAAQSYAPTLYEAAQLNEAVKAAMEEADLTDVFSIRLNSDYNFTDTSKKGYRYQAIFDVSHK